MSMYYKQQKTLTANDMNCWETGLVFYGYVNHLTQPVRATFFWIWSLEHRFYQLSIINAHLRVPVFNSLAWLSVHKAGQEFSSLSSPETRRYIIVFSWTAVQIHTHTYTASVLSLPFSRIHWSTTKITELKLLAGYVGILLLFKLLILLRPRTSNCTVQWISSKGFNATGTKLVRDRGPDL